MTENPTVTRPAPTVWPTFRSRDPRALIAFLTEAFGFVAAAVYEDDGGVVVHAELRWPEGGGVMLGAVRDDNGTVAAPGTSSVYVVTADVDALHARAVAAGADVTVAPFDTDYGSRDFAVRDPDGNHWNFGTYPGAGG